MISQIGPVSIALSGRGRVANLVGEELEASNSPDSSHKADLEVDFVDGPCFHFYAPEIYVAKGNLSFNKNSFYSREPVPYVAEHLFSPAHSSKLSIYPKPDSFWEKLLGLGRKLKMLNDPIGTSVMSYSLFWSAFHLVLLKKSASFFHAGVIANRDQEAIAFAGTGGSGKTSSIFKILEDQQFCYLSEDFGIVDGDGHVYYNPKLLSIYASDARDEQRILSESVQDRMTLSFKLKWLLLKDLLGRNPLIKLPVKYVLGDRICLKAKLAKILFLIRTDAAQHALCDVTTQEMATRVLNASLRELKWLTELLRLINANAPEHYNYPHEEMISEKMRTIYESAFRHAVKKVVLVPKNSTPMDTTLFLKKERLI